MLRRWNHTDETIKALQPRPPTTWIELVLHEVLGPNQDLIQEHLTEAMDFHRSVVDKAASHLVLGGDNTIRTPWLAARLLSETPQEAQEAAKSLAKHLATTSPQNRTPFEAHLCESDDLWNNIDAFSKTKPPKRLWHGEGRYEALFKFLAPRFLLAPDHVLDCERVHARWQWICEGKKNLRPQSLNATLRITHFLEKNDMPSNDTLFEHLETEREQMAMELAAHQNDGVALGWRSREGRSLT